MKRKILIFSLLFTLLLCQVSPVYAQKNTESIVEIRTVEEFLEFAENCKLDVYSIGKVVDLKADLDLMESDFAGIPYFDGTFLGNNHTISGIRITEVGSQLGLFRYVGELGQVLDLNVKGTINPSGSQIEIGGIAGVNYGIIQNCTFSGSVLGQESVGAIAGINKLFGKVIGCSSKGLILATNRTGGIVGVNEGTIEACTNNCNVNIEELEPVLEVEGMDIGDLNIAQTLITRNNSGGIAGKSSGLIKDSYNYGAIGYQHTGYNVGGIAGYQSGIIRNCENYGEILGRKDVGGIVGQAGPYIESEYLNQKVTQLKNSMNRMERTMKHLEKTVEGLPEDVGISKNENGEIQVEYRDWQTLSETMQERMDSVKNDMNSLVSQMNSLNNQVNHLADEAEEEPIEDISSIKNAGKLDGVVDGCTNHGDVEGDLNVGGIAGTMNVESTDDPELDTDIELDVATKTELNDVILSSINYGNVNGKKNCVGGVIGLQELGLVYDCEGYGSITTSAGNYVGGVVGKSSSTIEKSYSVSDLSGKDYVGGIAGEGAKILESLSIVTITSEGERLGAIAGYVEEDGELFDNYFVKDNYHGIDDISYGGQAEAISFEDMMLLEGIPAGFTQVKVTYMADGEVIGEAYVPYGSTLNKAQLPELDDRVDAYVVWPNEETYANITGNVIIEAEYIPWVQSIATGTDYSEHPLFIAVGKFYEGTELHIIEEETGFVIPEEGMELLYSHDWTIVSENEKSFEHVEGHFYVPEYLEGEIQVWIESDNGWEMTATTLDGSYAVADIPYEAAFAVIEVQTSNTGMYITIGIGVLVLILVISIVIVHNKRRKKAK